MLLFDVFLFSNLDLSVSEHTQQMKCNNGLNQSLDLLALEDSQSEQHVLNSQPIPALEDRLDTSSVLDIIFLLPQSAGQPMAKF